MLFFDTVVYWEQECPSKSVLYEEVVATLEECQLQNKESDTLPEGEKKYRSCLWIIRL